MLPVTKKTSEGLKEKVIKRMVLDDVTLVVRNESLILAMGEKLYQKHGHLEHMNTYISQKMRELARLLIRARSLNPDIQSLSDIIVPSKFADVCCNKTAMQI